MVVNVLRSAWRMQLDGYTPCGSRCAHSLCPVSISPSPDSVEAVSAYDLISDPRWPEQ